MCKLLSFFSKTMTSLTCFYGGKEKALPYDAIKKLLLYVAKWENKSFERMKALRFFVSVWRAKKRKNKKMKRKQRKK
jgi:hypothetical protein